MQPTTANPPEMDQTWDEIEELVHEVAQLSRQTVAEADFYAGLLDRAVRALAAVGGAVWTAGPAGFDLAFQVNLSQTGLARSEADQRQHRQLLETVSQKGEARAVAPHSSAGDSEFEAKNPTDLLLLLQPLKTDASPAAQDGSGAVTGLVEIFQRPAASPAAQAGALRLLEALAELAVDYHRNNELHRLRDRARMWERFEQFTGRLHQSLRLDEVSFAIANEGRRLIGCDRLSVAVRRGRKCRLKAVSGLDRIDRRANAVRRLDRLLNAVVRADETLWYAGDSRRLPPQIERPLERYLDEAHVRELAIVPLKEPQPAGAENDGRPGRTIGALVVERFDSDASAATGRQRIDAVRRQSEFALANALVYHSLPFVGLLRKLRWLSKLKNLSAVVLIAGLLAAAGAALVLVPADFEIEGKGELLPKHRREVFAGTDGVVSELKVDHGQSVAKGDVLVVLRRTELDFEESRVLGERQTAQKRLETVRVSLRGTAPTTAEAIQRYNQLAAEEKELVELLKSLDSQLDILKQQREELSVRSPIFGQVLTWDADQLLASRPVERGEVLLEVGYLDGPWVLEMLVPDHHMDHILEARSEHGEDLPVKFVLATDPETVHHGKIADMAMVTEFDEQEGSNVRITVEIDRKKIDGLRPRATVIPKVHCGRKPIGYVWFHDLLDWLWTRVFF